MAGGYYFQKGGGTMIFLSSLLQQNVFDAENRRVGVLHDMCVSLNETFPVVTALVVHPPLGIGNGSAPLMIPWSQVHSIEELPIHLTVEQAKITPYTPRFDELLLRRHILDKP